MTKKLTNMQMMQNSIISVPQRVSERVSADSINITQFDIIRQGKATNQLTKISDKGRNTEYNDITGEARIKSGDITVFIDEYNEIAKGLSPTTYRLLDALTVQFTSTGASSTTIQLPLVDYMDRCGLKDVKTARAQVKAELDTLYNISIEWRDKANGKQQDYAKTRICDSVGIKKGIILFNLTPAFYSYLSNTHIMPYPKQLYRINAKYNPHSFYFLRRISEHKNMNKGKSNEDIIAVRTLLECAPEMPLYEDLAAVGKISERIIEPFERDMDNLSDTLSWEYCHRNGAALKEEELQGMNYALFSTLMIKTTWKEYPDREPVKKKPAAKKSTKKTTKTAANQ